MEKWAVELKLAIAMSSFNTFFSESSWEIFGLKIRLEST
jgi:hypothetical protein